MRLAPYQNSHLDLFQFEATPSQVEAFFLSIPFQGTIIEANSLAGVTRLEPTSWLV
jgi:hypothetical protein